MQHAPLKARRMAWTRSLWMLVALAVATTPARGQGGVTLRGFVFDSVTAEPLGSAALELDGMMLPTTTAVDGGFSIDGVTLGGHMLTVSKTGFLAKAFGFRIDLDSPDIIDIGVLALTALVVREVTVTGTVTDVNNSNPIEGVRIAINDTVIAVTDFVGDFAAKRMIADGTNRLTVQRIGYQMLVQAFDVQPLATEINLMITLEPRASRLETIVVEAEPAVLNRKLEGFWQRRETEMGQFLTPEQIAEIAANRASDILRRIPAVRVRPVPGRTEIFVARCIRYFPRFYIDGLEVYSPDIDLMLNPQDIDAVEVYAGGAQVPLQFNRPAPRQCGVIVIWTK